MVKVKHMRESSHMHNQKLENRRRKRKWSNPNIENNSQTDSSSELSIEAEHSFVSLIWFTRAPERETIVSW